MKILSPAKVNLSLLIGKLRADGYHDIQTVFQAVDVSDTIEIKEIRRGIEIFCSSPGVPAGSSNLAYRAAELIQKKAKTKQGIRITITKKIPVSGGLGGGSSNASAVLLALNKLWSLGLNEDALMAIAGRIGADAPFFIRSGTAFASGKGEKLEFLPAAAGWLILANPGIKVSTAWAYGAWDRFSVANRKKLLTQKHRNIKIIVNLLKKSPGLMIPGRYFFNDFESIVIDRFPGIGKLKSSLNSFGATGALMTGSGSTVFGLAPTRAAAEKISKKLADKAPWVRIAKTIGGV